MTAGNGRNGNFRFADFEVNASAHELCKGGVKMHLEVQPFQVLLTLLERQGEVVTREELKETLWAGDTFVDFDNGVNQAISKIRRALGDSRTRPRFVETIPRVGYRFVGRIESLESDQPTPEPLAPTRRPWRAYAGVGLAAAFAAVVLYHLALTPADPPRPPERRFPPFVVSDLDFFLVREGLVEVSPNGNHVAYVAGGQVGVWDLNKDARDRRLEGTEGAGQLAWSPDSRFIAFRTPTALKLAAAQGTPPVTLWEGEPFHINAGMISWNTDTTILFSQDTDPHNRDATSGISTFEISREGGVPRPVDPPPGTYGFAPRFLSPARSAFLYQTGYYNHDNQFAFQDTRSKQTKVLGKGWNPWYAPSGHVVFESQSPPAGIWAMPFAANTMDTGEPFPVAEGGWQLSLSSNGRTLVYAKTHLGKAQLLLLDRAGNLVKTIGSPQRFIQRPDLSPDGSRVAVWGWEDTDDGDIWIHNVDRPGKTLLSPYGGMDIQPLWSPNGKQVAFTSARKGPRPARDLYIKSADENQEAEFVLSGPVFALDWSNDSRYLLLYRKPDEQATYGLSYLELSGDQKHQARQIQSGTANAAAFSPDGRYITFVARRNGIPQVYVCSFPECNEKQRVSPDGGTQVRWAKGQGGSIYYVSPNDALMEVKVRTQPNLVVGEQRELFTRAGLGDGPTGVNRPYDVWDDGRQFVVVQRAKESAEKPPAIYVWENWAAGFADRQEH